MFFCSSIKDGFASVSLKIFVSIFWRSASGILNNSLLPCLHLSNKSLSLSISVGLAIFNILDNTENFSKNSGFDLILISIVAHPEGVVKLSKNPHFKQNTATPEIIPINFKLSMKAKYPFFSPNFNFCRFFNN